MAKLFPIGIEVEEVAVGRVLRVLNNTPGVAKMHLNMLNEAPATEEIEAVSEVRQVLPPVRRAKENSSQMVVAQVLKLTPAHNTILKEALVRSGFSATSLPSLITKMRERGYVKRVGVGTWRITDKGVRHYGLTETKEMPKKLLSKVGPATNNGSGVRKLVLTALSSGSQVLARDLRKLLEENEYSPKNMTGTVGKMREEGLVQSNGGVYSLTEQGIATLKEVAASTMENNLES